MKRRVVSMLMVLVMGLSLTACGSSTKKTAAADETTTKAATTESTDTEVASGEVLKEAADLADIIPEETVTLTVYTQLANYSGDQIGWFAQEMLDRFNVKLNIINEGDGVFDTRMESGNLGDIVVFGNDSDQYMQAVNNGMLFDWNEDDLVADYGPYIAGTMPLALEKNAKLSGGTVYGFGHMVATDSTEHGEFFYHPDIRWDLYQQIGSPEVKTLEDYVGVLEQMVAACPKSDSGNKTYGVSLFADWDGDMAMFVKATAALYGYDEFGFGLYDVENQTYEPALTDGGMYLRCLKFYNTLYQKGLLDPDSMTQGYEGMSEDYQDGDAFFNIFDWLGSGLYNTPEHLADGKGMFTLAATDSNTLCYGLNVYGSNRIWSIGANTEYPELCMAIINWMSTPEGRLTAEYGPKGVTWDYDEAGNTYLTDFGVTCKADKETEMTGDYSGTFGDGLQQINNITWAIDAANPDSTADTYNYKFWKATLDKPVTDIEQSWRDTTGVKDVTSYFAGRDYAVSLGTTYSASTKSDELAITWNQVATCIKEYSWKAIYATSDSEYDSIVAEMKTKADEYGYAECVKFQENEAVLRKAAEDAVKAQATK